jgi:hypothetical protein
MIFLSKYSSNIEKNLNVTLTFLLSLHAKPPTKRDHDLILSRSQTNTIQLAAKILELAVSEQVTIHFNSRTISGQYISSLILLPFFSTKVNFDPLSHILNILKNAHENLESENKMTIKVGVTIEFEIFLFEFQT